MPLVLGLILAALAYFLADLQRGDSFVEMIGNLVIATLTFVVSTWLFTNLLGQFENGAMRHELIRSSIKRREPCRSPHYFVGFASPGYRNALDPHEDVGFIYLKPERLEFFGDANEVSIPRDSVSQVRFRPSPHTYVGLGRWICVEGEIKGRKIRLLIEPRERPTLLGNFIFSNRLKKEIEAWVAGDDEPTQTSTEEVAGAKV